MKTDFTPHLSARDFHKYEPLASAVSSDEKLEIPASELSLSRSTAQEVAKERFKLGMMRSVSIRADCRVSKAEKESKAVQAQFAMAAKNIGNQRRVKAMRECWAKLTINFAELYSSIIRQRHAQA